MSDRTSHPAVDLLSQRKETNFEPSPKGADREIDVNPLIQQREHNESRTRCCEFAMANERISDWPAVAQPADWRRTFLDSPHNAGSELRQRIRQSLSSWDSVPGRRRFMETQGYEKLPLIMITLSLDRGQLLELRR